MKTDYRYFLSFAAAVAILAASGAAAAAAQTEPRTMGATEPADVVKPFGELDTNNDGSLSREEVAVDEMLSQHFAQVDTDRNGLLSKAEVDAHRAEMYGKPD